MKYRNKEITNIQTHEKGCMCINHLVYYKEKHINVIDKFLEKIRTKSLNKQTNIENTSSKDTTSDSKTYCFKQKGNSSNEKTNSKTYINRKNLNTSF